MATEKVKWINLRCPPYSSKIQPTPVYYHSEKDGKEYLLISNHHMEDDHCLRYDIQQDEYIPFGYYPQDFEPSHHQHVLIPNTSTYCIVGGNTHCLAEYDLSDFSNELKIHKYENDALHVWRGGKSIYIPSVNKIYLIDNFIGSIDPQNLSQGIKSVENIRIELTNHGTVYSKSQDKIYFFGGSSTWDYSKRKIMVLDVISNKLEESKLSLPCYMEFGEFTDNGCIITNDGDVIILFAFKMKKIYCKDITDQDDETEWNQIEFDFPNDSWRDMEIILTKYNYIHFMNLYPMNSMCHYKIGLFDLIPWNIMKKATKLLVYGFVRESQAQLITERFIPHEIARLIWSMC